MRLINAGNCEVPVNMNSPFEIRLSVRLACELRSGNKHCAGRASFGWRSFLASNLTMTTVTRGLLQLDNGSIAGSAIAFPTAIRENLSTSIGQTRSASESRLTRESLANRSANFAPTAAKLCLIGGARVGATRFTSRIALQRKYLIYGTGPKWRSNGRSMHPVWLP